MHFTTVATLSLAGAAVASPCVPPSSSPSNSSSKSKYPTLSKGNAFNLVINVMDASHALFSKVNHQFVTALHTGAADDILGADKSSGLTFYQSATAQEAKLNTGKISADFGTPPPSAFGVSIGKGSFEHSVNLNAGTGQQAVEITKAPVPVAFLNLGDFAVCEEEVAALGGQKTNDIKLLDAAGDSTRIPKNCAPARLIPQCTKLNDLPKDSLANHDNVQKVNCYNDVSSIDYSKYAEFNWHNL